MEEQQELPIQVASPAEGSRPAEGEYNEQFYCALRETPTRVFAPGVTEERQRLINTLGNKWVSGTVLRYYYFDRETDGQNLMFADGHTEWRTWVGQPSQIEVVERGFETWRKTGIGIKFERVSTREEAEIRIGFMRGDGAWSWLGREILDHGPNERTMNFGWDLTRPGELDTAVHEIGHTLGFPHEHQNPNAGIEWDEEAVYAALSKPPNSWDRRRIYWNILRKLSPHEVEGTAWDPNSVMHYPFEKGLIRRPEKYRIEGLRPAGGLSAKDKSWALTLYPGLPDEEKRLLPAESVLLHLPPGGQRHFAVLPEETRYYNFQTFGTSDSVMVLFEDINGELHYRTGADDSGDDINAQFRIKLDKGRRYVLRVRLYYSEREGQTAVMMW